MLATILFAVWAFIGMVLLGLARIKTPQDTDNGKANPVEAATAWAMMLICWPLTISKRHEFARYGEHRDEDNPSWLADGRASGAIATKANRAKSSNAKQ